MVGNGAVAALQEAKTAVKEAAKKVAIQIPAIQVERMQLTLVGESPLIQHRWSEKAKRHLLGGQIKEPKKPKEKKDPWQDFVDSMYWLSPQPAKVTEKTLEKATFGVPSGAFKRAAVGACRVVDMKMTEARAAFHVDGEFTPIEGGPPHMREDMVRLSSGVADIRYRGEFSDWKCTITISYLANFWSPEQIVNLFNYAGFSIGVGEYRSEKNGSFGRFRVATEADAGRG
jgi:hypothetical protein